MLYFAIFIKYLSTFIKTKPNPDFCLYVSSLIELVKENGFHIKEISVGIAIMF